MQNGVASRVGEHLVTLSRRQVVNVLQYSGPERDGLGVCVGGVVDVQIEVDLLRVAVRPIGRNMVGRELYADHPVPIAVKDTVPPVVAKHPPGKHAGPEGALGGQVRRIENNDLSDELHVQILDRAPIKPTLRLDEPEASRERVRGAGQH
jgi:hypothetical protein